MTCELRSDDFRPSCRELAWFCDNLAVLLLALFMPPFLEDGGQELDGPGVNPGAER